MEHALIAIATLFIGPFVLSYGEWSIHKYVLHRPLWFIRFPFRAHTLIHHDIFKGDETYFLENRPAEDVADARGKIPMAWWAPFIVVPLGSSPFLLAATLAVIIFSWWSVAYMVSGIGFGLAAAAFTLYEYTHYCMHHPRERVWMKLRFLRKLFERLDRHHRIHHIDPTSNLNVVMFPFIIWSADWFFDTLRNDHPLLPENLRLAK